MFSGNNVYWRQKITFYWWSKYFKFLPDIYSVKNLVFLGNFNVPKLHTVFNPLKKIGFKSTLVDQKTTMKMKFTSITCLASEYDNIFYNTTNINFMGSGVVLIYEAYPDKVAYRKITDDIPVWMDFNLLYVGAELRTIISNK